MLSEFGAFQIAGVFTLGCMVIHGARRRPDAVSTVLCLVIAGLLAAIAIVATPVVADPDGASAYAATIDPAFDVLQPE